MHAASKEELEQRGFHFSSMKWPVFERILEQLAEFPKKVKKITFGGFGEPLLDTRLPNMIRLIKEKGVVKKILVVSNGICLTPELWVKLRDAGLDEIKISLQGMNAEKYKNICGVDINFDKLYKTLVYAFNNKGNCTIRIKVADTALDTGEDVLFYDKFGNICDFIAIEHIFEQFGFVDYTNKLYSGYKKNRFGYDLKPVKICSSVFFKLSVLQDGRITFGFPDGITYEGFNVEKTTLYKAWNSPERYKFLVDSLRARYEDRKSCKKCTRWAYSVVPEDLLDGHEDEILSRMPSINEKMDSLNKPIILCANTNC